LRPKNSCLEPLEYHSVDKILNDNKYEDILDIFVAIITSTSDVRSIWLFAL